MSSHVMKQNHSNFKLLYKRQKHINMGNLHSSPLEGKLLLEGPYTFQNNYQVPWAFPAIICLAEMTILPLVKI